MGMQVFRRFSVPFVLLTALLMPHVAGAQVSGTPVSDEQLLGAMKKGVDYLLTHRNGDNYEAGSGKCDFADLSGAPTSAVLYALGQVRESLEDPRLTPTSPDLVPVIKYVSNVNPVATYTASYQLMALSSYYKTRPEVHPACARAVAFLEKTMHRDGSYAYSPIDSKQILRGWYDNSNSQIAVLAMWHAEENGIEISQKYWQVVDQHWRTAQDASGGWCYAPFTGIDPRWKKIAPTMSAAGLASLYITSDRLATEVLLEPKVDKPLANGLAWVNEHYEPSIKLDNLYYLYSVERVGLASGRKFFGNKPWFAITAADLLKTQQGDGSWTSGLDGQSPAIDTAFALLVLARGCNPIMFNKLEYPSHKTGAVSRWDARPRDDAHLTRWMSREFEKPLNWQIVNLQVSPEEWLDAPILLITGSVDPEFTDADLGKIKAFVQAGGTIFSTSDGRSQSFTKAMQHDAALIVDNKYEMRELPKEHQLFTMDTARKINGLRIFGMSNGVREVWLHCPDDFGEAWQRNGFARSAAWNFPANLCLYCTGKSGFRQKLRSLVVGPATAPARHQIALARLDYQANADPEPAAWPRLVKLAARDFATQVKLTTVKIDAVDPHATPVAHLTGTGHVTFTAGQQAKLKAFIDGGGTLLVDAAGGNEEFAGSAAPMLMGLYPSAQMVTIPLEDELYSGKVPDTQAIDEVKYRRYYVMEKGRARKPQIQGIKLNGRWAVLYSSEDLTSGLLGTNTWGNLGYAPDSAEALVRNMLLYAVSSHH